MVHLRGRPEKTYRWGMNSNLFSRDIFSGVDIQIQNDTAIYKIKLMKAKRKYGPKWQKVKCFSHWSSPLKDGEVVQLARGVFLMNPRTKKGLDVAMEVYDGVRGRA